MRTRVELVQMAGIIASALLAGFALGKLHAEWVWRHRLDHSANAPAPTGWTNGIKVDLEPYGPLPQWAEPSTPPNPGDVLRWVPDGDKWVSHVLLSVVENLWRDHRFKAGAMVAKATSDRGGLVAIDTNDVHYVYGFRAGFDDGYEVWRAYWMIEDHRDRQRNPRLP